MRTTTAYMPRTNRTSTARIRLTNPFPGLSAAFLRRVGPWMLSQSPNRPETANHLFPQACVNRGSFPRAFTPHTFRAFTPLSPSILRAFTPHLHVVRQVEDLQVVGAASPVDKLDLKKNLKKPKKSGALPCALVRLRQDHKTLFGLFGCEGRPRTHSLLFALFSAPSCLSAQL